MPPSLFLSLVRRIAQYLAVSRRVGEISVIGGEPTLLGVAYFDEVIPQARKLLQELHSTKLVLVTNLMTDESLKVAGLFDAVTTSYDPAVRFTGTANLSGWEARCRELFDHGDDLNVSVTLTRPVIEYGASHVLEYLAGLGFRNVHFGNFIPVGVGLSGAADLRPEFENVSQFLIDASKCQQMLAKDYEGLNVSPLSSLGLDLRDDSLAYDLACPVATGSLSFEWDGKVSSCVCAGGAGELETALDSSDESESIEKILDHQTILRARREALTPPKRCLICEDYRVCLGGCRRLHQYWQDGECPGLSQLMGHMRCSVEEGL